MAVRGADEATDGDESPSSNAATGRSTGTGLALVVGALAAVLVLAGSGALVAAHGNHAEVNAQVVADGTLVVESAFILEDGHVVVHRDAGGEPGEPIGHVSVADGFHGNLQVALDSVPDGESTVWVVLHEDDGDGEFQPADDPALQSFGSVAGSPVAVRSGRLPAYLSAPSESSQSVADGSVQVGCVAAPADGHVVLRRIADGEPGEVVGATRVPAGTSENVTVPIDESFVDEQRQYFGVYAVLATGDDGEYGTSVTVGEEPVLTRIALQKGDGDAEASASTETDGNATADGAADASAGGDCHGVDVEDVGGEGPAGASGGGLLSLSGFGVGLAVAAVAALVGVLALRRRR